MTMSHLISRLSICAPKQFAVLQSARTISLNSPLLIQPSQCLYKESMKKRRKIDPGMIKAREEKRKRKIEREIRRLTKFTETLKPIEELQLPLQIQDQFEERQREDVALSPEEEERRSLLFKVWSKQRKLDYEADVKMIKRVENSQKLALSKLREESEELYQAAIQIDESLVPVSVQGPTCTPPVKNYDSPDGEYIDASYKWD